jgi:hypothetical protein
MYTAGVPWNNFYLLNPFRASDHSLRLKRLEVRVPQDALHPGKEQRERDKKA